MGIFLLTPYSVAQSTEHPIEQEIETLDVVEITGTIVEQAPPDLNFPIPQIHTAPHLNLIEYLPRPRLKLMKQIPTPTGILLDQTAKDKNIQTPAKPLKMNHPPYPRQAREKGWHGRVILHLKILANGTVESGTIYQSSGHQLLDDSAIKAAAQWTFQPAKNGGFPVTSIAKIPIQFNLVQ